VLSFILHNLLILGMNLSDHLFEIAPGSLEDGQPTAFVAKLPAIYRDLLQFGRVALEVLPKELQTPELLAAYPKLVAPTRYDTDVAGDAIYSWNDNADHSKGLSHASETAWFAANKDFLDKTAEVFKEKGKAITYLLTRNTLAAQEDLRTNSEFAVLRSSNDLPKIFKLIHDQLMFGPKKASLATAQTYLKGSQTGTMASFVNRIDVDAAMFLHTFGYAGQPQPTDHSNCINHDKLKKAVLFMNTTDSELDRYIERFQETKPEGTYREAAQYLLGVVRERVALTTHRVGKVTPAPSAFTPRGLMAESSEEVPMCYLSNSGPPPPPPLKTGKSTKTVRPGEPWNKRSCEHCWSNGYDNPHHKKDCEHHKRKLASQARRAAKSTESGRSSVSAPSAYSASTTALRSASPSTTVSASSRPDHVSGRGRLAYLAAVGACTSG
jgi:hypothetical protein